VNNGTSFRIHNYFLLRERFLYFRNQDHPSFSGLTWEEGAEITESYCTPEINEIITIAQEIKNQCRDQNDDEEIINALLSYTQGIGYKSEIVDLPQYPIETLVKKGDCEDLSILFGSLVEALGYEAIIILVLIYADYHWIGHCVVGVYLDFTPTQHDSYPPSYYYDPYGTGDEYWICETTDQGWRIGELPVSDDSDFSIMSYEPIN
jgi:hypothetical protein